MSIIPPFGLPKLKAEINPTPEKGRRILMRTISQLSNREFQGEIEITMQEKVWNRLSLSTLPARVASYLKKLNSPEIVDKTSFSIKTLWENFNLPEDLVQYLMYEDRADVVETAIREHIRQRQVVRRGRRIAERIGLHYWPAIAYGPRVDPKAYLVAEKVQSKGWTLPLWGDPMPGTEKKSHGGWDMDGKKGNTPGDIARMWYNAGCKDSPKFRIQVARHTEVPKRITGGRVRDYLRGLAWVEAHSGEITARYTPRAMCALGRISPWARWVATHTASQMLKNEPYKKKVDLNELDWAEVARLQKLPKWRIIQEAPYLPMRLRWEMVKETVPGILKHEGAVKELTDMIGNINVSEVKPGLQSIGEWEAHKEWSLYELTPTYASSMFFRKELRKALDISGMSLHDLGQSILRLPQEIVRRKTASSAAWVAFCFATKLEALKYAQYWKAIEEGIGRLPKSLEELEALCRRFQYGYVAPEHEGIAQAAASLNLGQREYEQYKYYLSNTPKSTSKCLPEVKVEGADILLKGDWVLESLAPGDPIGPMLGLATNCCQHLDGAAKSCAKAIWKHRRAGAWVVRYKGKIVAQSYIWVSADVLVVDSIEALSGAYVEGIAAMYKKAAKDLTKEGWEVYVGHTGYGITREVVRLLNAKAVTQLPDRCPSYYTDAHGGHRI